MMENLSLSVFSAGNEARHPALIEESMFHVTSGILISACFVVMATESSVAEDFGMPAVELLRL